MDPKPAGFHAACQLGCSDFAVCLLNEGMQVSRAVNDNISQSAHVHKEDQWDEVWGRTRGSSHKACMLEPILKDAWTCLNTGALEQRGSAFKVPRTKQSRNFHPMSLCRARGAWGGSH
eukprot:1160921-Pelagomonas_calceolata.AAC.8